jgi:hypothetical protein
MLDQIDRNTPKDKQLLAMKALDSRLAEIGGGGYVGLGFKLRGLKACGFDDHGWPNPLQKLVAYQKAIEILNQLGDNATAENFMQAASSVNQVL